MDNFFKFPNQPLNSKYGFGMFSIWHFLVLFGLLILIFLFIGHYNRINFEAKQIFKKRLAWIIVGLEIFRELSTGLLYHYDPELLPLHLCGMSIFVILFDAYFSNKVSREILYALTWWGAILALILPDWANRPILNIFVWQSFLIHALIISYVLMRVRSHEIIPNWKNLPYVAIAVFVAVLIAISTNSILGTNFWFLNTNVSGSPMDFVRNVTGNLMFYPSLILLLLVLWSIIYLPWKNSSKLKTDKIKAA